MDIADCENPRIHHPHLIPRPKSDVSWCWMYKKAPNSLHTRWPTAKHIKIVSTHTLNISCTNRTCRLELDSTIYGKEKSSRIFSIAIGYMDVIITWRGSPSQTPFNFNSESSSWPKWSLSQITQFPPSTVNNKQEYRILVFHSVVSFAVFTRVIHIAFFTNSVGRASSGNRIHCPMKHIAADALSCSLWYTRLCVKYEFCVPPWTSI